MDQKQIYNVPPTPEERSNLRNLIAGFVGSQRLCPPLSLEELSALSDRLVAANGLDPSVKGWVMVEVNNSVWLDTVASIPHDKRILLLPKCLSDTAGCKAGVDELGLLCYRCGSCPIPGLQDQADSLGMMSIVAEGFTSVVGLIENRVVDTVIGVSCLDSLEKAFPLLIDNAVPGLAVPLNKAGCKDTTVDYEYVSRLIAMRSGKEANLLDYDNIKTTVKGWFTPQNLERILPPADDHTSLIARQWLGGNGKRWRPYLLASAYLALSGEKEVPREVQLAAVAIECFHKASLVHDDIQDNDSTRYGEQTVNAAHGAPIAINVGDILLGLGYRLLAHCDRAELLKVAADAHIALCKGQGMELEWSARPRVPSIEFTLGIFANKTVPAFDVSLAMGVICAGDDAGLRNTLRDYSRALGIAYQLQDDLADAGAAEPVALRPSAILAAVGERQTEETFLRSLRKCGDLNAWLELPENEPRAEEALGHVRQLAETYRREALAALGALTHVELKRLLFRITRQILK